MMSAYFSPPSLSPSHIYCFHTHKRNLITWKHAWTKKLWVYSSYMSASVCCLKAFYHFQNQKLKTIRPRNNDFPHSLLPPLHFFSLPFLIRSPPHLILYLPQSSPIFPPLPYSLLPQISSALLYSGRLLLSALGQRCVSAAGQDRRVYEWRPLSFGCEEIHGWGGGKGRLCVWHVCTCVRAQNSVNRCNNL